MIGRLRAVLPRHWFGDAALVLDGVLAGLGATASWAWSLLQTVGAQTRLMTATGSFLDMAAADFFGSRLLRAPAQSDAAFRVTLGRELLRERGTRAALTKVLGDLTGRAPVVFEPARPADTGAWGLALGYGAAGGWGSLSLPYQCFVTAFRPNGSGIALVSGWGQSGGGYGAGVLEYASLADVAGQVTDADINAAIAGVTPTAAIAWTRITD